MSSQKCQYDYHNQQQHTATDASKRSQKRKRVSSLPLAMSAEQKQARMDSLLQELDGLFAYYKEVMAKKLVLDLSHCSSINALIASFIEESHLPLSLLVSHIYDNLRDTQNAFLHEPVTLASIKTSVLSVGQRFMYGVPNADADVLEDDSESCLWCWETRDIRLLPKSVRGEFNVRRICRRRIHERIASVSAMVSTLRNSDSENNCYDLIRATEKLDRAICVADIHSLVDQLLKQKSVDMAEKEAKRREKLLVRQMEKSNRESEKERKRMESELRKERGKSMAHEKHLEKEVYEMRKQSGNRLEETEKCQRRREKEKAELKRKLSLQKQVSMMERFLKRTKNSGSCENGQFSDRVTTFGSSRKKIENLSEAVTQLMDSALTSMVEISNDDIMKSHLSSWHSLAWCIRSNREQHWGLRRKPKTALFKELKLTSTKGYAGDDDSNIEKFVVGWPEAVTSDRSSLTNADNCPTTKMHNRRKQLLQFDNSPRPAFYGVWPKRSNVVGARHPFRKDPDLDYDMNSDEEWEEEEPGESLSDCEIDEDESSEGCSKSDEDETEDGFFVPDGYLSENEGVQVDRMKTEIDVEEAQSSLNSEQDIEDWEFCALLQQEKFLHNLTEHALRKNQPFVVLDFMHDKAPIFVAQNIIGMHKLEEKFLQALRMCAVPGSSTIGVPGDDMEEDVKESPSSYSKVCTSILDVTSVPESELSTVVSTIQTCSQGINRVLECLQQKFPAVSKSSLRNKVREISYFADNHWQVKKEVLDKLGLGSSPEKKNGEARSISTYFSKRCMPPTGEDINP